MITFCVCMGLIVFGSYLTGDRFFFKITCLIVAINFFVMYLAAITPLEKDKSGVKYEKGF